jgi:hydroxymethylbilane synthase
VGTRGSVLALAQTRAVIDLLSQKLPKIETEVVKLRTAGDMLPPEKRGETDGKGAFTGDIEDLLARGELDLAVHSLKDLSVVPRRGLKIGATPPRGDPRDALVSLSGEQLSGLSKGASLGTSSIRRKAQLLMLRRDLRIVDVHGNVETRVRKMTELHLDGVVLAAAGLDRLSLGRRIAQRFSIDQLVPAAGQGTIAVQVRSGDREVEELVSAINDEETMRASECERAFARAIGGDCYVPAGAYASVNGRSLTLVGMIASSDGRAVLKKSATSTDPVALVEVLGNEMLRFGGAEIIKGAAVRV